jgi:flagellar motor switch protein FliM
MCAKVLSPEEVEELLTAKSLEESSSEDDDTLYPIDITNMDQLIRGRIPMLEIIYETFIKLIERRLTNLLKDKINVYSISTDLYKYNEWINILDNQTIMSSAYLDRKLGPMLIYLSNELSYTIPSAYLGATKKNKIYETRNHSAIDLAFINTFLETLFEEFQNAFSIIENVQIEIQRMVTDPLYMMLIPPSDVIVISEIEIESTNFSGKIYFGLPYLTLEPIKNKLASNSLMKYSPKKKTIDLKTLNSITHEVKYILGECNVTASQIQNLKIGDQFILDRKIDELIDVMIGGQLVYKARLKIKQGMNNE